MKKNILYKHFKGFSSQSELSKIRNWVNENNDNHKIYLEERVLFDTIQLSAYKMERQKEQKNIFRSHLLKIASILIIFSLGSTSHYLITKKKNIAVALNTITVPPGQSISLILSDSTQVWLNSRTTFSYPSSFNDGQHDVYLDGEAFFSVSKKVDNRKFIVHTNQCNIEVLGTEFNVDSYSKSEIFSTTLFSGSLRITDSKVLGTTLYLEPNHILIIDNDISEIKQINNTDLYSWKNGLISFKKILFKELIKRLEKCYAVRIIIENEELKDRKFSGKFRISDGLETILRVLQKDSDFLIIKEDNELYRII